MKTLEKFLIKHSACEDGYDFAKDLILKEFLKTCDRADWILWLFRRTNPESIRELTLINGLCANIVRHLMKDKRSIKAVDTAIAFSRGKASEEELDKSREVALKAKIEAKKAWAAADAAATDETYAAEEAREVMVWAAKAALAEWAELATANAMAAAAAATTTWLKCKRNLYS